jgi:spore maturation protein CgeB
VIGWSGSAVLDLTTWGQMDLILSCAPESVEHFRRLGLRSRQLHHGFDPRVLSRTGEVEKTIDFCFAGQLVGAGTYYVRREHILEMLTQDTKMEIFASLPNSRARALRALLRAGAYCTVYALRAAGVSEKTLCSLPVLSRAAAWKSMSRKRSNPKLKPFLRPAVYGIEMFRTLMSAKVALNVHADPMPRFASNARLFEITGAGTCMVTERLENIHDLFEPDREVVTYGSPEECVEKVKWLMEHAEEREKIARAGQARTLRDHTWSKRAEEFDSIIKRMV